MITMEMMGKVRRMSLRDGLSRSEIAKRTGLSRNTVRKWLKESAAVVPKYRRREVAGKLQCVDQVHRRMEPHPFAIPGDAGHPNGRGQMGFARARPTDQNHVVCRLCWRQLNSAHPCQLNIDQGRDAVQ